MKREDPCPLALLSCRDVFGVEDHDIFRGMSSTPPLLLAAPVLRIDADGSGEVVRATLAGDVADESVGAIVVLRCFFPNTRFWTIESTMAALPLQDKCHNGACGRRRGKDGKSRPPLPNMRVKAADVYITTTLQMKLNTRPYSIKK